MSKVLYLQTEKNKKITSPVVTLGDIADLSCQDPHILARNQVRKIAVLPKEAYGRYVCSVSDIIREITKEEENLEITHIGEPEFLLTYENPEKKHHVFSYLKTAGISILSFFGTAFSIMTFHTDVGIRDLFDHMYQRFSGISSPGFGVLEISYSIGIGLGVILYFNHFGKRRLTQDPTPLEVEMRLYEDDIDTTIIEQTDRFGKGGNHLANPAVDPSRTHRS